MVRMIPPYPREGANFSERQLFSAFEAIMDRPDWTVIHSLSLTRNLEALTGEADFIVIAPGKGILIIEAKSPKWAEYRDGDWYLDRVPSPTKSPLKQLEAARRSIRGFLKERGLLTNNEPIARLLWFTSLGRHQFENKTVGDMQLFEWELGWHDDLAKPKRLVEKVLDDHAAWFAEVDAVDIDPTKFTAAHAKDITEALLADFKANQSRADQKRDRLIQESHLLEEQQFALELVEGNEHIYFDGPAGTGKSLLLALAARRLAKQGKRTLVTCWNVLMADQLSTMTSRPDIEVADLNALMLKVVGTENPADATSDWYERTLPELALAELQRKPHLGGFEAICVDEFQDIAGNPLLVDVIFALAGSGGPQHTNFVFAGDARQQILRKTGSTVDPYSVARALVPDLVHVGIRRNCRTVPSVISGAESLVGRGLGFSGHRVARSVPGGLEIMRVDAGAETTALATALRTLLEHHDPEDIVVLSPFGGTHSTVGALLARTEKTQDERWLRKQLVHDGGPGRIQWRSIFKYKGLEAEAVVITDVGDAARGFIAESGLDWDDLMYVGVTRGKYRVVVVADRG
jgi:hypothetical protein